MMTPVRAPTREQLTAIAAEAGVRALAHFRVVTPERKHDRTLVTAADREVEAFLVDALTPLFPGAGVIGEEGARTNSTDGSHLLIDPIDGTAAFVAGLPTWCVCFGLLRGGAPTIGVVHMPVTGDTCIALDGRAWIDDTPLPTLSAVTLPPGDAFALAHAKAHVRHQLRYSGKVRSLGSTAYHLALVAQGVAEAALVGRVYLWDLVGPLALVRAVGGDALTLDGSALDLTAMLDGSRSPDFTLAAAADRLPELLPLFGGGQ
jgi:myo-inositol-1(or 4)-monophosphatase